MVLWTLVGPTLQQEIDGEQVDGKSVIAFFQSDGKFNENSFLRYLADGDKIGGGLSQFSLCMWISLNFLRGKKSVFLSYATENSVESLFGAFQYDNLGKKKLTFCTYGAFKPLCVEQPMEEFDFQTFHHVCFVVSVTTRQRKASLFYDGESVAESMYCLIS